MISARKISNLLNVELIENVYPWFSKWNIEEIVFIKFNQHLSNVQLLQKPTCII